MNIRLTLDTPIGDKHVGMVRTVLAARGLVNDQGHLKTPTFIYKHDAPMAFAVKVVKWAADNNVRYIVARDNNGRVWLTHVDTMLDYAVLDNLGCEDQLFLHEKYWVDKQWKDLGLEPVLKSSEQRLEIQ